MYLNRTTQDLLGEFLSLATLDVFEAELDAALKFKDTDSSNRTEYFRRLALAFGDLFWCHRMDFYLQGNRVAHGDTLGQVVTQGKSFLSNQNMPLSRLDEAISISPQKGYGNLISFDISQLFLESSQSKLAVQTLGFDRLDCHAFLVLDKDRFAWGKEPIRIRIQQIIQNHRDAALISLQQAAFVFGHMQRALHSSLDLPNLYAIH
jgi:hypothetical protein